MKSRIAIIAGLLAGAIVLFTAPAMAGGDVRWSVNIGTPVYPAYPVAPAVVYAQPPVVYAPPPVVYTPPPRVVYAPQPYYQPGVAVVEYDRYYHRDHDHHDRGWHRHHRDWD